MIDYQIKPTLSNLQLNELFECSWPEYTPKDFLPILDRSLTYIGAFNASQLIGFVNIAWDGGVHTFILDTTVHPTFRKQGIGTELVLLGIEAAKKNDAEWIHVDYEPKLDRFYKNCGFRSTQAGLVYLPSFDRNTI